MEVGFPLCHSKTQVPSSIYVRAIQLAIHISINKHQQPRPFKQLPGPKTVRKRSENGPGPTAQPEGMVLREEARRRRTHPVAT